MKVNIALARKGEKFKTLYVGNDADKALEAMQAEADSDKSKFDEVVLYKSPLYHRRRKISA